MRTDFPPPVDPRLRELLLQFEPGPVTPENSQQDMARRVDAAWDAFAGRAVAARHGSKRVQGRSAMGWSWLIAGAACLLLALGIGTWSMWPDLMQRGSSRTFVTKPGQQMTLRLADGSTVILAPATSLTVAMPSVAVRGAAYFIVAPQASRPFTVRTRNADVQVLGTRFEVRQFDNESVSRVVVEDGRVALQPRVQPRVALGGRGVRQIERANQTIISARMMAQVSDSGVLVQSGIDPRSYTGLTTGALVFTKVPLEKVVAELSRAYGAEIRVSDSLLARQIITMTAAFSRQPLSQVLDILAQITNAHVTRAGEAFVVVPGRTMTPVEPLQQYRRFPQPEKSYGK